MQDLERGLPAAAWGWLQTIALEDKLAVLAAFSGAGRRVGKAAVETHRRTEIPTAKRRIHADTGT
jgi:hypothetical protein